MQERGGEKIKGFKNLEAWKERKVKPETTLTASRTWIEFLLKKIGTLDMLLMVHLSPANCKSSCTTCRKADVSPAVIVEFYKKAYWKEKWFMFCFYAREKRCVYFMVAKVVDLHLVMTCPKNIFNLPVWNGTSCSLTSISNSSHT